MCAFYIHRGLPCNSFPGRFKNIVNYPSSSLPQIFAKGIWHGAKREENFMDVTIEFAPFDSD